MTGGYPSKTIGVRTDVSVMSWNRHVRFRFANRAKERFSIPRGFRLQRNIGPSCTPISSEWAIPAPTICRLPVFCCQNGPIYRAYRPPSMRAGETAGGMVECYPCPTSGHVRLYAALQGFAGSDSASKENERGRQRGSHRVSDSVPVARGRCAAARGQRDGATRHRVLFSGDHRIRGGLAGFGQPGHAVGRD